MGRPRCKRLGNPAIQVLDISGAVRLCLSGADPRRRPPPDWRGFLEMEVPQRQEQAAAIAGADRRGAAGSDCHQPDPADQPRCGGAGFASMGKAGWGWARYVLAALERAGGAAGRHGAAAMEAPAGMGGFCAAAAARRVSGAAGRSARPPGDAAGSCMPSSALPRQTTPPPLRPHSRRALLKGMPHLVLAEAGTGTGKTLGYLAPASLWAEKNQGAVWISTYTRHLQRQIESRSRAG